MQKLKSTLLICFCAVGISSYSQILTGSGVSLYNSGNSVHINGNFDPNNPNTAQLGLHANTNSNDGASLFLWHKENTYYYKNGSVDLCSYGTTGHSVRFVNYNPQTSTWVDNIVIYKNGKMVIGTPTMFGSDGTTTPGDYLLYVSTGILTEKIKVAYKNTSNWADYVFRKNYVLMPLPTLKAYIDSASHLPGIPSAEEVVKNGSDLGQMNAKLLEKVEELTLYMIHLNEEIEKQKVQIAQLQQMRTKN
jgi:hypothetical protein